MDCIVHGVAKSQTRLSNFHFPMSVHGASQLVLVVKNLPANAGDTRHACSIPGSGRSPGGGHSNPLQYPRLKNSMDKSSLGGYSPRGHKESDTTEHTCLFIDIS